MKLIFLIVIWTLISSFLAQEQLHTLVNCSNHDGSGPDAITNQGDDFIVYKNNNMATVKLSHSGLPILTIQPKKLKLSLEFSITAAINMRTNRTNESKLILLGITVEQSSRKTKLRTCSIDLSKNAECEFFSFMALSKEQQVLAAEFSGQYHMLIVSDNSTNPVKNAFVVADLTNILLAAPIETPVAYLPTALTFDQQDNSSVLIYDYIYSKSAQTSNVAEKYYSINSESRFKLSQLWLGCPTQLCFDGQLDSAMRTVPASSSIMVRRGFYSWTIDLDSRQVSAMTTTNFLSDAIFRDASNQVYVFQDGAFSDVNDGTKKSNAAIFGKEKRIIDAAFALDRDIYLIVEDTVHVFHLEAAIFKNVSSFKYKERWAGLPEHLDAATVSVENNVTTVYIFKNDLFYTISNFTGSQLVSGPFLTQKDMIECSDTYYRTSQAAKSLNITNLADFVLYKSRFESNLSSLTTPLPSTRESTTQESTTKVTATPIKNGWKIILYVVAFVMLSSLGSSHNCSR
ncbi:hypothetical protein HDE_13710 [Halotydeus destructor]|nr:hypothetical protein HDE_13710 [Halotydeus destructor]